MTRLTVRAAAGAILAGLAMSAVALGLIDVHNTGAAVHDTGVAVAGIHQLQMQNIRNQDTKDAALQAQVTELQGQVTALESDIAGLTGSNAQLAKALEADIAELRALGLRPVVEVPVAQPAAKASPTTTTVPRPTTTTTACAGLARLLGVC